MTNHTTRPSAERLAEIRKTFDGYWYPANVKAQTAGQELSAELDAVRLERDMAVDGRNTLRIAIAAKGSLALERIKQAEAHEAQLRAALVDAVAHEPTEWIQTTITSGDHWSRGSQLRTLFVGLRAALAATEVEVKENV